MRDQQAHWLAGIGGYLVGLQKYTWLVCRNTPAGFDKDQHAEEAHDASMHLLSWSGPGQHRGFLHAGMWPRWPMHVMFVYRESD